MGASSGKGASARGVARFQRITAAVLAVGSLCSLLFVVVLAKHTATAHAREQGQLTFPPALAPGSVAATESDGSSASGNSGRRGGGVCGYDSFTQEEGGGEEHEHGYETLSALMPGGLHHQDSVLTPSVRRGWDWFGVADFYWCALVYMGSRIVVNISQVRGEGRERARGRLYICVWIWRRWK